MVGDGDEAENIFQEGLKISNAQDLPLGQAAFGSCLGIFCLWGFWIYYWMYQKYSYGYAEKNIEALTYFGG